MDGEVQEMCRLGQDRRTVERDGGQLKRESWSDG